MLLARPKRVNQSPQRASERSSRTHAALPQLATVVIGQNARINFVAGP
jgi:hypothetical protein